MSLEACYVSSGFVCDSRLLHRPHQTQTTTVVLAVGEPNTLKMMWVEMDECSAYMRYQR